MRAVKVNSNTHADYGKRRKRSQTLAKSNVERRKFSGLQLRVTNSCGSRCTTA